MDPLSVNALALRNSCLVDLLSAARKLYNKQEAVAEVFFSEKEENNDNVFALMHDYTSISDSQKEQPSVSYDTLMELVHEGDTVASWYEDVVAPATRTFSRTDIQNRNFPPSRTDLRLIIAPDDVEKPLSYSNNMSRVVAGTMVINNVAIPVDPVVDSFADIIARINASTADVHALFDPRRNKVVLESLTGGTIAIMSDTSNFLEEVNIRSGNFKATTDRIDEYNRIDRLV